MSHPGLHHTKGASNESVMMRISSSGFFLTTSAIIALCCLMTALCMFLTYKVDNDSFDVLEAFLSIKIIIRAQKLNELYSTTEVAAVVEMPCSALRE